MTVNTRKWVLLFVLSALVCSTGALARAGACAGAGTGSRGGVDTEAGVEVAGGRIPVGIWIDTASIPRDSGAIRKMVDDLAHMGVVDVYVEVFNRGLTMYPSAVAVDYGLPAQKDVFRDAFAGLDPLSILLDEAHLRGLRVHAWLDLLYVGYKERGPLLDRYPSWEAVARDGSRGYGPPANQQHWLSPANPEARRFLTGLVGELVSRYEVDGVHLDYIRYPDPVGGDYGYEPDCVRGFVEEFGVNPFAINTGEAERGDAKSLHELSLWNAWRAAKVTELVSALAQEIRTRRPEVLVSAAVAPTGVPDGPHPGLLQDWPKWVRSGILDFVVPMTYTSRPEELRGLARWTAFLLGWAKPPTCGVQMWKRNSPGDVVRQLEILREEGAAGAVLFAQSYLSADVATAVRSFLVSHDGGGAAEGRPLSTPGALEDRGSPQASVPMTVVPFVSPPPHVDGDLSDDAWLNATPISLCYDVMKPGRAWPGENPQVRIVHDEHGLYMAFSAVLVGRPPSGRQPVATRDGPVFYDDSFEIFVNPTPSESLFYHFAFNLLGTRYDATRLRGPSWDHDWEVACRVENDTWYSEVFVPFDAFGRRPDHREEWGLNVCMSFPDAGRFVSWAPLPGIYAAPSHFGRIEIE